MNQVQRSRRKGQVGFTLIELLVVIAVLAVLATVVIFNVTGVKNKGNNAACSTDAKSVQAAVDSYISEHSTGGTGTSPSAMQQSGNILATGDPDAPLLVPQFLHSLPDAKASCQTIAINPDGAGGWTVTGTGQDGTKFIG